MDITRRTFLKGAAAMPLVTIPGIVSAEPLPNVTDVLMAGADVGRPESMTELDTRNLIVEATHEARRYLDGGSDVHWMSNNLMEWVIEHADIEDSVFAGIAMLWAYNLPLDTEQLPAFEAYHDKCGKYIMNDVAYNDNGGYDGEGKLDRLRIEVCQVIDANPRIQALKDTVRIYNEMIEKKEEAKREAEYWAARSNKVTTPEQYDWHWIKKS